MTSCGDMKVGEVYVCPDCGVEVQVIKGCGDDDHCRLDHCALLCCDKEMELKSSEQQQ